MPVSFPSVMREHSVKPDTFGQKKIQFNGWDAEVCSLCPAKERASLLSIVKARKYAA